MTRPLRFGCLGSQSWKESLTDESTFEEVIKAFEENFLGDEDGDKIFKGIGICQKMLKAKKALWAKLGVPMHEDGIWLLGQQLHLTFLEAKMADILTDKDLHVPEKIRELRNSFKETNAEILQCEVTVTNIQPSLYAQWLEQQKDF